MKAEYRILQLGKFFPPDMGGIEAVSFEFAKKMSSLGVCVETLCTTTKATAGTRSFFRQDYCDLTVFRCRPLFTLASMAFAPSYIWFLLSNSKKYDLLWVHLPNPLAALPLLLCPRSSVIVLHWHSDVVSQRRLNWLLRPIMRRLIKRADAVVGATSGHIDHSEYGELFESKSFVIPYIYDLDEWSLAQPDDEVVEKLDKRIVGKKLIFSIGRFVYYKGFEYLISAAKYLDDEYVICIGGDGPLRALMQRNIEQAGLADRVFLPGRLSRKEMLAYMDRCCVFVFPSTFRSEMFGMVQLEAFSRGKPVVSTRIEGSGVSFVNKDGVSGLIVEPKNPEEIAKAVVAIASTKAKYEKFSSGVEGWYKHAFDHNITGDQHLTLIQALINKRRGQEEAS